jgi:hypothetical protein
LDGSSPKSNFPAPYAIIPACPFIRRLSVEQWDLGTQALKIFGEGVELQAGEGEAKRAQV